MSYKKKTLKNGLRVITAPIKGTGAANVFVLFRVGSRYEEQGISGVSHFLEHMAFKGTAKRPTAMAVAKELDGIGAEYNAFTSKDYTGYFVKANSENFAKAIDVLSDMVLNSKVDAQEVEREKSVIVEEINMYEDNPIMHLPDLLEELVFEGNSLGGLVSGTRETVRGMSRDDIVGYMKRLYSAPNAVLCLAGNFNADHVRLACDKFSALPSGEPNSFEKFSGQQSSPRVKLITKPTEQVQAGLAFPAYPYGDKRLPALQLLSVILGGNMSSRLFSSVRERHGLAYYIHSYVVNFEDTGMFYVQSGLDKSRINEAVKLIVSELKRSAKDIKPEEMRRAKDFVTGKTAIDLEDSSAVSQWYAAGELLAGRIMTPEEKLAIIRRVTAKQVMAVAKEIFDMKKASLAVIGPYDDEASFRKLLA